MIIVITLFVLLVLLIIINISIPWTGDLPFKLKDTLKSVYIKLNHKHFGKPLNKKIFIKNK